MRNLESRALVINKDHLPRPDFLGQGVCFRERTPGVVVDTLIVHSCYVDDRIIRPARGALAKCDEALARELAGEWLAAKRALAECGEQNKKAQLEERASEAEFYALHALVMARHGAGALQNFNKDAIKDIFEFYGVSAHYLIDRDGAVFEFVAPDALAFHAGKSKMPRAADGREGVNAFSVGVELLATEVSGFSDAQYAALNQLAKEILKMFPLINYYGHSDIAAGRKTDPHGFDWSRFVKLLGLQKGVQHWSGEES
ncbi:MAG: N-acetylmuramoyl-L-alanine amidase [Oligoflexia bacterium]|nr:N-acetylmuramoyl-L-alanine amidase [Oligoflexia bacterium]